MDKRSLKVVSLFDGKIQQFLTGLKFDTENVKSSQIDPSLEDEEIRLPAQDLWSRRRNVFLKGLTCRQCGISFEDVDQQRIHFKSDWHVENLRRKLANLTILTKDEHYKSIEQDIDTDSNEEDEDDERDIDEHPNFERKDGSPYLYFQNHDGNKISIFRVLLCERKESITSDLLSNRLFQILRRKNHQLISILMLDSCRFAGAVFQGEKALVHKRLRYYTVRAQSGTRQTAHDNKCHHVKRSVGATIRRANETSLINNTQNLLRSWSDHINSSDLIFLRCPPTQKFVIFGGKEPILNKDDAKIRYIPLTTKAPSSKEVKRIYSTLFSIRVE